MKIYFSGSIRGGREDAAIYRALIERLSRSAVVLTEHIGSADLTADGQTDRTDADIFRRDVGWIEECDLVLAECTTPSLGVGYELCYAERLNKPIYVLFHEGSGRRLSAMIAGNPACTILRYTCLNDLVIQLDTLLFGK